MYLPCRKAKVQVEDTSAERVIAAAIVGTDRGVFDTSEARNTRSMVSQQNCKGVWQQSTRASSVK